MKTYHGTCHCGGMSVAYQSAVPPAETEIRACQCAFCRMHASLTVSDPNGALRFGEKAPGVMRRYTFGLKTADYLLCGICGAYLGAVMRDRAVRAYGIVNIRVLADRAAFTRPERPAVYDGETVAQRIARRRARWTPLAEA